MIFFAPGYILKFLSRIFAKRTQYNKRVRDTMNNSLNHSRYVRPGSLELFDKSLILMGNLSDTRAYSIPFFLLSFSRNDINATNHRYYVKHSISVTRFQKLIFLPPAAFDEPFIFTGFRWLFSPSRKKVIMLAVRRGEIWFLSLRLRGVKL